jgi:Zn ribbon nucleic-acid-binding protein
MYKDKTVFFIQSCFYQHRAYIKARSKLGCSLKQYMLAAFWPSCVSYDTVRQWKKKFESGVECIKNAPKSGWPKSSSRNEIV